MGLIISLSERNCSKYSNETKLSQISQNLLPLFHPQVTEATQVSLGHLECQVSLVLKDRRACPASRGSMVNLEKEDYQGHPWRDLKVIEDFQETEESQVNLLCLIIVYRHSVIYFDLEGVSGCHNSLI